MGISDLSDLKEIKHSEIDWEKFKLKKYKEFEIDPLTEKIHFSWIQSPKKFKGEKKSTQNTKIQIGSFEGRYTGLAKRRGLDREDRLYFIQIENGTRWYPTHNQQIELIKYVLRNDILDKTFYDNVAKFKTVLANLILERKQDGTS